MAGAEMGIFEKIDTERHRRDINLCKPVRQQDATGFSAAEPNAVEASPSDLVEDPSGEQALPQKAVTPTEPPPHRKELRDKTRGKTPSQTRALEV